MAAATQVVDVHVASLRAGHACAPAPDLRVWMTQPDNVYIGRRGVVFVEAPDALKVRWPPHDSEWANPHKVADASAEARSSAVAAYETDLRRRLAAGTAAADDLRASLRALKGKLLGCWCAPRPCHGDVLVRLIEEIG